MIPTIVTGTQNVLLVSIVPILFAILVAALYYGYGRFTRSAEYLGEVASTSLAFGLLATCVGVLMALSREPAVGTVLPAALSLIGGVALYLVNGEGKRSAVTITGVLSFSVMLLYGGMVGGDIRESGEAEAKYLELQEKYDVEQHKALAERELLINTRRTAMGLSPLTFD
ncbi:MAG: hypothetical protein ACWA5A_08065 [Marinibacterium sp.]